MARQYGLSCAIAARDFAHAVKRRGRTAWAKAHNALRQHPRSTRCAFVHPTARDLSVTRRCHTTPPAGKPRPERTSLAKEPAKALSTNTVAAKVCYTGIPFDRQ